MKNLMLIIGMLITIGISGQNVNLYPDLSKNDTLTIPYVKENFKIPFGLTMDETIKFLGKDSYEKIIHYNTPVLVYNSFLSFPNSNFKIEKVVFSFHQEKLHNVRLIIGLKLDSNQYKKNYNYIYSELTNRIDSAYKIETPWIPHKDPNLAGVPDEASLNVKHNEAFRLLNGGNFYTLYFKKEKTQYQVVSYKLPKTDIFELLIDNIFLQKN